MLQRDMDVTPELVNTLFPDCVTSVRVALCRIGNPKHALERMQELLITLCRELEGYRADEEAEELQADSHMIEETMGSLPKKSLYLNETFSLMLDRWEKLNKELFNKKTMSYDLTKVPDVYDMVRYDVLHNSHVGLTGIEELLRLARDFADVVVPLEYGISRAEKVSIGSKMCGEFCSMWFESFSYLCRCNGRRSSRED